jgi:hypothetical protein
VRRRGSSRRRRRRDAHRTPSRRAHAHSSMASGRCSIQPRGLAPHAVGRLKAKIMLAVGPVDTDQCRIVRRVWCPDTLQLKGFTSDSDGSTRYNASRFCECNIDSRRRRPLRVRWRNDTHLRTRTKR